MANVVNTTLSPPIQASDSHSIGSSCPPVMNALKVYELLIRRVNAMRWLFGMKPRQRTPREDRNGREQEGHKAEAPGGKAEEPVLVHTWKEDLSDARHALLSEHAFFERLVDRVRGNA